MPDWGAIPWLGVLVAVVASQIIGFLWYGPLFGKPWMAARGMTPEDAQDRSGLGNAITIGVIASIVSAVALALLLSLSETPDVTSGWKVGLLAAAVVASYVVITMAYEKTNSTLAWIAIGNQVVTLAVMGAILGAMW